MSVDFRFNPETKRWYHFKIVMDEDKCEIWIDNVKLQTIEDVSKGEVSGEGEIN